MRAEVSKTRILGKKMLAAVMAAASLCTMGCAKKTDDDTFVMIDVGYIDSEQEFIEKYGEDGTYVTISGFATPEPVVTPVPTPEPTPEPTKKPKATQKPEKEEKEKEKDKEKDKEKEKEAYEIAMKKIQEHKLDMKLINTEYTFDGSKILFYFTADGRVDFRELVKSLAGVFRTRIELRQMGVRDEAKTLGAIGICGRALCCSTFLNDFHSVSIRMAKDQGLSLNPTKISGICGRLMCCLQYEQNAYEDLLKKVPNKGALVEYEGQRGVVTEVFVLKSLIKVKFGTPEDFSFKILDGRDVKVLKKGKSEPIPDDVPKELKEE